MQKLWIVAGVIIIIIIILIWLAIPIDNTIPATFTGKHLEIGDTKMYLSWDDQADIGPTFNTIGSNISAKPYASTLEQLWDFTDGRLMIQTDKGISTTPGKNSRKYLRWNTNGDPTNYDGYYTLLWSGGSPTDIWTTDGKYIYNKSYSDYTGIDHHLALVGDRLKVVPPNDTTSIPITTSD